MNTEKIKDALEIGLNYVENSGWTRSKEKEITEIKEALEELEKPEQMKCPSCHCVVDKKGIGHHSVSDCVFMHFADLHFAESYHAKKCDECIGKLPAFPHR